jgi:hypothetical protein
LVAVVVSLAVGVLVVVLVSLALVGLSGPGTRCERRGRRGDVWTPTDGFSPAAGHERPAACLPARAAAIVLYGLFLIVF